MPLKCCEVPEDNVSSGVYICWDILVTVENVKSHCRNNFPGKVKEGCYTLVVFGCEWWCLLMCIVLTTS